MLLTLGGGWLGINQNKETAISLNVYDNHFKYYALLKQTLILICNQNCLWLQAAAVSLGNRKRFVFETQDGKLSSREYVSGQLGKKQCSETAKDKMRRISFATLITYFYLEDTSVLVTEKNTKETSGKQWAQRVAITN